MSKAHFEYVWYILCKWHVDKVVKKKFSKLKSRLDTSEVRITNLKDLKGITRQKTAAEINKNKYKRGIKRYRKQNVLCLVIQLCLICDPWTAVHQAPLSTGTLQARILEWVAMTSSRGSSQPQESNPGLPQYRQLLYHMSHQGSPWLLEWVAYPFFRGIFLTQESNQGSYIAGPGKPRK